MTENTSPENLRKFLESDEPALVRMGISMAKGGRVDNTQFLTTKDLNHFLKNENLETVKTFLILADEAGIWILADETSLGDEVMEMLCEFLKMKDGNEEIRNIAIDALGKIGDKRAVEPLIKTFKDYFIHRTEIGDTQWINGNWVSYAAEALGKIGDKRAVAPLIKALEYRIHHHRNIAAEALGNLGDKRAVEPLIKALKDEDEDVRESAAYALNQLGHEVKKEVIHDVPDPGDSGIDDLMSKLSEL